MSKGSRIKSNRKVVPLSKKELRKQRRKNRHYGITTPSYYFLKIIALACCFLWYFSYVFYKIVGLTETEFYILQIFGVVAYPLTAYLCVESYYHTEHKGRHFLIMLAIAILSEPLYDYVLFGKVFTTVYQNPVFSLAAGFVCLKISNTNYTIFDKMYKEKRYCKIAKWGFRVCLMFGIGYLTNILHFEYSYYGIILMWCLSKARKARFTLIAQIISFAVYGCFTYDDAWLFITVCGLAVLLAFFQWCARYDRQEKEHRKFIRTREIFGKVFSVSGKVISSKPVRIFTRFYYPAMLVGMSIALYFVERRIV